MKNLFIVSTPYQCLIASSIALEMPLEENHIILLQLFTASPNYIESLKKIFSRVYVSSTFKRRGLKNTRERLFFVRSLYDICIKLRSNSYNSVYSSNDNLVFNQYFINKLASHADRIHIEDGSFEYKSTTDNPSKIKRLIANLKWSIWLRTRICSYSCIHPATKLCYLTFPEKRRVELQVFPSTKISVALFIDAVKRLYEPAHIPFKMIFCLDHSQNGRDFISSNKIIYQHLIQSGINAAVKYHPREVLPYMGVDSMAEIDRNLAFEAIYLNFDGILLSNMSSVLHTAKFIRPNAKVICTLNICGTQHDDGYAAFLKSLGVYFPKAIDDLVTFSQGN